MSYNIVIICRICGVEEKDNPDGINDLEKTKFEAKLLLEINDKQTRTKGDLKQAIEIYQDFSFGFFRTSSRLLNSITDDMGI